MIKAVSDFLTYKMHFMLVQYYNRDIIQHFHSIIIFPSYVHSSKFLFFIQSINCRLHLFAQFLRSCTISYIKSHRKKYFILWDKILLFYIAERWVSVKTTLCFKKAKKNTSLISWNSSIETILKSKLWFKFMSKWKVYF